MKKLEGVKGCLRRLILFVTRNALVGVDWGVRENMRVLIQEEGLLYNKCLVLRLEDDRTNTMGGMMGYVTFLAAYYIPTLCWVQCTTKTREKDRG